MAEYSIDIPVAAEKLELDFPATMEKIDRDISVIPENMELESGNARGNSGGKTGGAYGRAKALPNYLSSPPGSCHDICKYGKRQCLGEKEKRDREAFREGEDFKQTETVAVQKKKSPTSLKPSSDPETRLPGKPRVMRDVWSLVKNVVASSKQIALRGKRNSNSELKTIQTKPSLLPKPGFLSNKRKGDAKVAKDIRIQPESPPRCPRSVSNPGNGSLLGSPSSGRKTGIASPLGSPKSGRNSGMKSPLGSPRSRRNSGIKSPFGSPKSGRNSGIGPSLKGSRSGKNTGIGSGKDKATSLTTVKKVSAAPSAKKVANIKTKTNTNVKGVSHLKNQSNTRKTGFEHPTNETVPEKILHVIEPKAANKTVGATQNGLHTARLAPSFEGKSSTLARKGTRVTHLASSPEKKNQRRAQAGVRTSRSPPSISPPPSMNRSLLHTRKGIHKRQSSVSSLSSTSSPTSPSESIQSEDSGIIYEHSVNEIDNPSEVEYKRRVGKISSGDEKDSPRKLKSRRGLQHEKGRGLNEADSRKRSFKRTESVHIDFPDEIEKVMLSHPDEEGNKDTKTSITNKIEEVVLKHLDLEDKKENQSFLNTMIEGVVLRHQDVEDKKDDQSYLNSMIEEVVLKPQDVEDKKENQGYLNSMIEEVMLKHQDVEDKKENRVLLNNMIEETASKLVQTRKSKVKALVGAFESLISLQDTASLVTPRPH